MADKKAIADLLRLGHVIREKRLQLELSQEDFAERCDLHRTYIGQLERGEKNLSFSNLLRVSVGLGTRPSELLRSASL
tara:strand:+ start:373 stop:606 length:234 start_codon:yes stop_codon:yes gene_type:complete